MGLGDLVSKVLVEFRGDTSDLKSKLKDLSGVEKERTKALVDDIEKQNRGYESAITKLGHVGLALDTLGKAYDAAKDAMKVYGETLRLESATAGVNIGKLSESFGGLINKHDLMTFAAQTNTGVLKLNQGQMETLGQAALALKNRGFDLEESLKKLTDAAVKGKVGGLDDLGLSIKEGASNAETLKNMMTELNKVITESGTVTNNEADAVKRLSVEWENATTKAKGYAAQAIMSVGSALNFDEMARQGWMSESNGVNAFNQGIESGRGQVRYQQGMSAFAKGVNSGRQSVLDSQVIQMPDMNVGRSDAERKKMAAEAISREANEILRAAIASSERNVASAASDPSMSLGQKADTAIYNDFGVAQDEGAILDGMRAEEVAKFYAEIDALYSKRTTVFETIFGSIETVDMYTESFRVLGGVFDSFGQAVGAGYEALITDSEPVGKAIKKMAADQLMAIGKTSAVRALQETALGVGSLALGPIGGVSAAAHFKAAALHAGVALAAGAAAHSIGTSAQVAASDKAADEKKKEEEKQKKEAEKKGGKSGSGGSTRTDENGRTVIVAYLNPFAMGTPSERGRNARNLVQSVLGGDAGNDS